ncbi:hypothetical protein [uncultured Shimia sp.]|uniref:hypothetical protein n=1 Tax=uncultured Shimia sp. TaxID=573152 RepID=UPI00261770D7|nr:hypothetical protein [uncultured Shimia sp.]
MSGFSEYKSDWDAVMDETKNPFKTLSLPTAHMLMQLLAWMWSAVFSISVGSFLVFGVTAVGHVLVIAGIFITIMMFKTAEEGRG